MNTSTWNKYSKYIGKKFGNLFIKSLGVYVYKNRERIGFYSECDCGKTCITLTTHVLLGISTSCGCKRKEETINRSTTHGESSSKEYKSYMAMLTRCNNPKSTYYHRYGGRGIKCLFKSFDEFFKEIGLAPTNKHQVDRINNDGNYEKGNVRWVTNRENQLNKGNNLNANKHLCIL